MGKKDWLLFKFVSLTLPNSLYWELLLGHPYQFLTKIPKGLCWYLNIYSFRKHFSSSEIHIPQCVSGYLPSGNARLSFIHSSATIIHHGQSFFERMWWCEQFVYLKACLWFVEAFCLSINFMVQTNRIWNVGIGLNGNVGLLHFESCWIRSYSLPTFWRVGFFSDTNCVTEHQVNLMFNIITTQKKPHA